MELVYDANRWFDRVPEERRLGLIIALVVFAGLINMAWTISFGFPFGLLVLLTIAVVAALRIPYLWGWVPAPATAASTDAKPVRQIEANWLWDLNVYYDGIAETPRFFVLPVLLIIAGAINMRLTIDHKFPFALLFLIVLLACLIVRVPYINGWVKAPAATPRTPYPMVGAAQTLPIAHAPAGPHPVPVTHDAPFAPPHPET